MGDHFGFVDPQHPSDEIPLHNVYVDSFYMETTLLTCLEYVQFLNSALINSMVMRLPAYNLGLNLQWQPADEWYGMIGSSVGKGRAGTLPWTDFDWDNWSLLAEFGYAPRDFLGLGPGVYRIQPFLGRVTGTTETSYTVTIPGASGAATYSWGDVDLSEGSYVLQMFAVSSLAETNRVPFDLPESESELVAGYHAEYSSMRYSMFPLAEYANIITTGMCGSG